MGKSLENIDCVIITNDYPSTKGEPFLNNEIKHIAHDFKKIYVFSLYANKNDALYKEIPSNVVPYCLSLKNDKFSKVRYFFNGLLVHKISDNSIDTLKKYLSCIYIKGKYRVAYKKIIKEIEKLNLNDVVLYSYWFSYQAIVNVEIKKKLINKVKKVISISRAHGYDLYSERNVLGYLPFQEYIIKNIDKLFPCSNNGRDYLIGKYKDYADKIETSYLGTNDYGKSENNKNRVYTIATCCSALPVKRLEKLAKALSFIDEKGKCIRWICIGDGPLLETVKNITKNYNNIECEFLGRLANEEVFELYKQRKPDLFVNVSSSEGLPVSIMEVTSFGIPVLATNVGGTSEIVNSDVGELIDANITDEQLADKLLEMMNKKFDSDKIRNYWQNNFSAEKNYRRFIDSIEKLL